MASLQATADKAPYFGEKAAGGFETSFSGEVKVSSKRSPWKNQGFIDQGSRGRNLIGIFHAYGPYGYFLKNAGIYPQKKSKMIIFI